MSYLVRKHDIANLVLVVGGVLMFLFHLSALVYHGYNPWDPWLWIVEGPVPGAIFMVIQIVGSIGGVFVIVLAYIWNKENSRIFASIITFFMVFSIFSGVIHANISYYGLGFGIPIVLTGLLISFGGAAKYDRYTKILALGTHMPIYDGQEQSEETQPQSEIRETEEVRSIKHDRSTRYCVSCAARIPIDSVFCIECGTSQGTD